jgi:4-amino-4-deoxy-L-arabinose transferase-like glycosyltransferase
MKRIDALSGAAALVALSLFLFFWGLGQIPFYTKGEPREGLVVWEAVHSGDWILPLRNGHEIPSKPPLFHWIGALTALVVGRVDEFTVRFPSALLSTFAVLVVFWLGLRKWGVNAGLYAGIMLATNFEWLRAATTARVDMTLTAFLVAAFVALDRVVSADRPSPRALAAFYVCMGLAALGKGPVGILLPALVAVVYLALRGDLRRITAMRPFTGAAVTLSIAGFWYAAAIARGGGAFVQKQLLVENVLRFFAAGSSGAGHVHPFYYTIGGFLTGFAPWSFFVIPRALYL